MHLEEYVDRFIEMIQVAVARLYPECDLTSSRSKNLLYMERQIAIQDFQNYFADQKRNPAHDFLMKNFERWGVVRSELFAENERLISEEEFVDEHINFIKECSFFRVAEYSLADYQFIVDRERHYARCMFEENITTSDGFQELNIECSKKKQEHCLRLLRDRFESDCSTFYDGLKKRA